MKSYVQVIRAHPFVEEMRFTLLKMDATARCNDTHEKITGISEELACGKRIAGSPRHQKILEGNMQHISIYKDTLRES
jgi:hypothetical protein